MFIKVEKIEEAGYKSAMYGLSLNKNNKQDMQPVAEKLAPLDYGHNKFLESMIVWTATTAPRYWWQDADTYRISTKQSQSTNHTIMKRMLIKKDFENSLISDDYLSFLNKFIEEEDFLGIKPALPEGFLQTREWCFSYKTFSNIVHQRYHHILPHWRTFIVDLHSQIFHPEFIKLP
jgi:hypothetical protein